MIEITLNEGPEEKKVKFKVCVFLLCAAMCYNTWSKKPQFWSLSCPVTCGQSQLLPVLMLGQDELTTFFFCPCYVMDKDVNI